jgi:glycerol-3-phosphate dehydrogenase
VTPADVIYSYAGVRPLVDDGSGKPETASRGYHFELDTDDGATPILSVFGGKITTYRHLAESAMERLTPHLTAIAGESWTMAAPLPGGDFPLNGVAELTATLQRDYPFLAPNILRRWVRSYGSRVPALLGTAASKQDLGIDFGHGLYAAEVDYLIDTEYARTADDILWRRSKLGLRFNDAECQTLAQYVASRVANEAA